MIATAKARCYSGFAQVFFAGRLRKTRSEIRRLTKPKLQHYIQEHTGGACHYGNVAQLREILLNHEKEQEKAIIEDIMKPRPCCAAGPLTEQQVAKELWFRNIAIKKNANPIPELTMLSL